MQTILRVPSYVQNQSAFLPELRAANVTHVLPAQNVCLQYKK
jgi:hypothetical protein